MVAAASKKEPNPFTENKRDAILKFYRPSDKDYAFVYVKNPKTDQNEEQTETLPGERTNYAGTLMVPTGFEPDVTSTATTIQPLTIREFRKLRRRGGPE
jgi:hypothetical protein